eukprot:10461744-Karenia_brevis.AAC.1
MFPSLHQLLTLLGKIERREALPRVVGKTDHLVSITLRVIVRKGRNAHIDILPNAGFMHRLGAKL